MNESKPPFEQLKEILENFGAPERLDDHPWTRCLSVREAVARDPALAGKSPGIQLAMTLGNLFRQTMPATPPQKGKRLDTRWGRFGILAANYFAPLMYGRLHPHSLREAWRRIDQAVLLFVYDTPPDHLKPEQAALYRLVGDELDFPANSTISDWHRGGLQDLTDSFIAQEKHLSLASGNPSVVFGADGADQSRVKNEAGQPRRAAPGAWGRVQKWGKLLVLFVILAALIWLGNEALQIYRLAQTVRGDISSLEKLNPSSMDEASLDQVSSLLDQTRRDIEALREKVSPWLWLSDRLGWMPVYGGDLKYAGDILETASGLVSSAQQTFQTAYPIWQKLKQPGQDLKAADVTALLLETRPSLEQAQATLEQALTARRRIVPEELSPKTHDMLLRADPYLSNLEEALTVALAVPNLLGATNEGPKSYLILIQNEDELRPTGGFITSVGKVVVFKGELISWSVDDSYSVDDADKVYPQAPWQMRSFMNIPVFVFRDANWYTDYPTAATWAEYLYAFTNSSAVDGVIAIDQHVLASILSVTGPVYVSGLDTTVTAENVREVMRARKVPPPPEERDPGWHRKQFMKPIASAILERLLSGKGISWESALRALTADLDQRHILVQLDDPTLAALLAERGWDGAVRNGGGDYLMVVDSNVGYNKTNAVVGSRLTYDVDLTDPSAPVSSLVVSHRNHAQGQAGERCNQHPAGFDPSAPDYWYPIDQCYYDYLRVYVPIGAQLFDASAHAVTREEMIMLDQDVPARVDLLNEIIENVQGFGTLLVVPMGQSLETGFRFDLPAAILQPGVEANEQIYRLKIQKQAGIESMPVIVRVHLPTGAEIRSVTPNGLADGGNVMFELELREDIEIEIVFRS